MKTPLKLLCLVTSSLLLTLYSPVKAQWVTIPDSNFVFWLNTHGFSQCMNGNRMDTTCPAVVNEDTIECDGAYIHDLSGIRYFDNLKKLSCRWNYIVVLAPLPPTLRYLDCWYNDRGMTTLPALPATLKFLACAGNIITSLPPLPDSLETLYCYSNMLDSLPPLPNSLKQLLCGYNNINGIPPLPPSLEILDCKDNNIPYLPPLPATLIQLVCDDNLLDSLPVLPNVLRNLSCAANNITDLPLLPNSLTVLNCAGNPLGSLPSPLPPILESLYCGSNQLSSLPPLPNSLNRIWCEYNQLRNLTLPPFLTVLSCAFNPLYSLPVLPVNLRELDCSGDSLSSLPSLPSGLLELKCGYNQLTSLPTLPSAYMKYLYCNNNLLTSLPELPDYIYDFRCDNNLNLTCLPQLKEIRSMDFRNTAVTCLPNYGDILISKPALSSVPLCGIFNNYGCDVFWNISGKTYFDKGSNCLFDSTDVHQKNMKIQLWNSGVLRQQEFTAAEGFYSFDVTSTFGNYNVTVDTSIIPFTVACPAGNLHSDTISVADSLDYSKDFALICKQGFDVGGWSIYNRVLRVGHFAHINITAGDIANYYGVRCAYGVGGSVTVTINGPATYLSPDSGALSPSSVSGNIISWNVADFGVVNFFTDFNIIVQTHYNATLGSQVCFTVSVTPTAGDNNLSNNNLTHCFTVIGPFDPNDKQVYPSGNIDTLLEWLTYSIRFQNTGTADAQHVYIDDTLDANLDESSFQLLAYSHDPIVQINGNAVRFNFPNINLPDSNANEPASHGYVQYKVKMKDNLPIGTHISNTAYIYFDFNAPIVTNTVTNTITVAPGHTIAGSVLSEAGSPVAGATISLTGSDNETKVTAIDGLFSFDVTEAGSYYITPSKNNDVTAANGVTTRDILLTRRHILGIQPLGSPYKILAADVDASSSITTSDIVLSRALILGMERAYPNGRLWIFVNSDFVFADSLAPYAYESSRNYSNITTSYSGQNFIGIKLGDVNNSWDPATPKQGAIGNVQLAMDTYTAMPGDEIIIPMQVKDFKKITGYQFTLSWDAEVLSLLEINNKALHGHYGEQHRNDGLLTTSWNTETTEPVSLDDETVVFELKFKVIGNLGSQSEISIISSPTLSEAYNENLELMNIVPTNGVVKVDETDHRFHPSQGWNLSVAPNPFANSAQIIFTIPEDATVDISIYDLMGRQVKSIQRDFTAGEYHIEWAVDDTGNTLAEGLYYVRLISGDFATGVRAIVLK